jgi:hypothetical protein
MWRREGRGCGFGFGVGAMEWGLAWLGWAGTDIIWTVIMGSANRKGVLVLALVRKVTMKMRR